MPITKTSPPRTLGLGALSLVGCSPTEEDAGSLTLRLGAQEVASIKASIRQNARANISLTGNWDKVRQQLDPLISKLEQHQGAQPAVEKLPLLEGAWRQIWSDFSYPMSFWNKMDPEQIYQVVTRDGYYYNLSDSKALPLIGAQIPSSAFDQRPRRISSPMRSLWITRQHAGWPATPAAS